MSTAPYIHDGWTCVQARNNRKKRPARRAAAVPVPRQEVHQESEHKRERASGLSLNLAANALKKREKYSAREKTVDPAVFAVAVITSNVEAAARETRTSVPAKPNACTQ